MTLPLPEAVRIAEAALAEFRGLHLSPADSVQVCITAIFLMAKANGKTIDSTIAAFRQEWEIAERSTVWAAAKRPGVLS